MRLRRRARPTIPADWVQPRASGRTTSIGTLDSGVLAGVDPAGLVTPSGASWSLDWWVGAEDRWHVPSAEVAVRQGLMGSSPVVETRLRVPSGDAVHRAYAGRGADGAEAVVIEVENDSKVPFALAIAVRPYDNAGAGSVEHISVDGVDLCVDGALVQLPKSPGRLALSNASSGDAAEVVFRGDAAAPAAVDVRCRDRLATAALLFPLAHGASLRIVIPVGSSGPVDVGSLPPARHVADGWAAHAAAGTRIEVPDRRLRDGVAVSVRHLLLGGAGPAPATALAEMGCAAEARQLVLADPVELARDPSPVVALLAVVRHWELTRDLDVARDLVSTVAALAPRVARSGAGEARAAEALAGARGLLAAVGEERAASDVAALIPTRSTPTEAVDLAELLSRASSTWTWMGDHGVPDLVANATLVRAVRDMLVAESSEGLALSPVVPEGWLGQGWELHDAPTRFGALSYAVRWHGDRPALLWDLRAHDDEGDVRLTAPGLDPSWSTTERKGEALLAAVPIPERGARRGISIPVSIEPNPGRS